MKSTKKIVSLLGVAVLALVGCKGAGTSSVDDSTSSAAVSSTTVDNTKYTYEFKVASPNAQTAWVKTQVQAYLKDNGYTNCTVKSSVLEEGDAGSVSDWTSGPDIFAYASDQVLALSKAGAIGKVPTKIVNQMVADMGQAPVDACKLGDDVYGLPFTTNSYFLYYNTDFVSAEQAKTVDGLIAANKAKGAKTNYKFSDGWYGIPSLMTFGAKWQINLNEDGTAITSVDADFDSDAGVKAAKGIISMIQNPDVISNDGDQAAPTATAGYGSIATGNWNQKKYADAVGADKLKATILPSMTVDGVTKPMKNFTGFKQYGVNPLGYGTDTAKAAIEFNIAAYLVSEQEQLLRYEMFGASPLNKVAAADKEVADDQTVAAVNGMTSYTVPQSILPSGVWKAWESFYKTVSGVDFSATDENIKTTLTAFNNAVKDITA
ncbi:MAG: hypothetical protein WCR16_00385 [Bacilli bacterium]